MAVLRLIDQLELGRLFDREVGRFRPAQNLVHHFGGAPPQGREVWSIGYQAFSFDVFPVSVHGRQASGERQHVDGNSIGVYERFATDVDRIRSAPERIKDKSDILGSTDFWF